jgi:UDP-N-acetylglucosamine transferase subunit ALG13
MVSPGEFRDAVREASITVAHAGMGSFFVAMEMQKSVVMLPRIAANGEHTTDHQLHTLHWLREKPCVFAAMTEEELAPAIEKALNSTNVVTGDFNTFAPKPFLANIRRFLTD